MLKKAAVILFFIISFWNISETQQTVISEQPKPMACFESSHINFDEEFAITVGNENTTSFTVSIFVSEEQITLPEGIHSIWKPPVIS